jgi:hypothetical protein
VTVVAQWVTVVAQFAKAPGVHCYVAGSIPAVTPRYCTKKREKMLFGAQKTKKEKKKYLEMCGKKVEIRMLLFFNTFMLKFLLLYHLCYNFRSIFYDISDVTKFISFSFFYFSGKCETETLHVAKK